MLKEYIQYLKDNPNKYWFRAKWYGWGWTPATWQGWLSIAVYLLSVVFLVSVFKDRATFAVISLTIALIYLAYKTGEKPKWQWGRSKPKDK